MVPIFPFDSWRSKRVPSGTGDFPRLLVGELETSKLAQIFAYGKLLYPYKIQLHGVSDLDQRCLKTRRSAVVAFLVGSHQISLPLPPKSPKTPFWGTLSPFNAKPIVERVLRKSHVNGPTKLKLYIYIGIGKYLSVCQNFSARARLGAQRSLLYWDLHNFSETTRAKNLNLKIPLDMPW